MSSKLLYHDHAVIHLDNRARDEGLFWPCSIGTLLLENSREEWPDSAIKKRVRRGNRSKWGTIPFSRLGNKKVYRVSDLDEWFESIAKPILEAEGAMLKSASRAHKTASIH